MRPPEAKVPQVVARSPAARLPPSSASPARTRPEGAAPTVRHDEAASALPAGFGEVSAVDADPAEAVGRVLAHVLSDRLRTAGALDGLFAADLAARVDHFTRTGGKRTRAQLLWWSLRACGGGSENIVSGLRLGAAIELLQTCALVHDDVMDGSRLRRGGRALHADVEAQYAACAPAHQVTRFSAAAGILAGDLALVWADDLVAETALPEPSARAVRRVWSDMRTQMVAGQYLDVHGQVTAVHSPARALRAACLKSALYSVERPLTLGAVLAGADNATRRALYAAGRCVGVAFQLRDDLTDVFGEAGTPGEDCGGDVREGKTTYLLALARARAEAAGDGEALAVLDASLGDAALTGPGLDEVRHVVERTGARGAVEKKIGRLLDLGLRHYDGAVLDPVGGAPLRRLLRRAASGASSSDPDPRPAPRGAGAPAATSREARR